MEKLEIWKDIPNYKGMYQASNLGRIKSLKFGSELVMNPSKSTTGYLILSLSKKGKQKTFKVHRLVALAFLGKSDLEINHLDENITNNRLSNLEYVTHRENQCYKSKFKHKKTGAFFDKSKNIWRGQITINNKRINLGYFPTEQLAHEAYLKALEENGIKNKYASL